MRTEVPDGHAAALAPGPGRKQSVPFRQFVLKIAQRCNLVCDYCYVYNKADQSWRTRPPVMSQQTWSAAAERMAEHVESHGIPNIDVILHGGEPLLVGVQGIAAIVTGIRSRLQGLCHVEFTIQTNGTLLSDAMLKMLSAQQVRVGVSLDGMPTDHNRHRQYMHRGGSFAAASAALERLRDDYYPIYAGILCVVDLEANPKECYRHLLRYRPPAIDLLLPHANWDEPPRLLASRQVESYGKWLTAILDEWVNETSLCTRIRLFDDLFSLILGGSSRSEQIGLSPVAVVVVETDGQIEQVDSLKSTYPGAASTGYNVVADDFDTVLTHPGIVARQAGRQALSPQCRSCEIVGICGGGHYAHRYRPGSGFDNPSVYCNDMVELVEHAKMRIRSDALRIARGKT